MRIGLKAKIKKAGAVLFVLYVAALVYFLFFSEQYGRGGAAEQIYRYNLVPLKEIRRFWIYRDTVGVKAMLINIGGNVVGFIPFGLFLPLLSKNSRSFLFIMLSGLAVSLTVETIQLIGRVGSFDVDDLLLNTIGAVLGYFIFKICKILYEALYSYFKGA
ncbi:MAG: VanZ family protein [Lachnospiraceae bacterium]